MRRAAASAVGVGRKSTAHTLYVCCWSDWTRVEEASAGTSPGPGEQRRTVSLRFPAKLCVCKQYSRVLSQSEVLER